MSTKKNTVIHENLHVNISGQGVPLVMIHGIISDSTFFDKSAVCLAEKYQVITYDRRGYGNSDQVSYSDYTVRAQAEDLICILRTFCREPAWILGNSAGSLIALEAALNYPELIRGMILLEPSLGYDPDEREKLLGWNRELNEYVEQRRIKRALMAFSRVIGGKAGSAASSLQEMRQTYQNLETFMYGELNEVQHYLPPIESLMALKIPVVIGVTEDGRDSIFATSSESAARLIGWPVVRYPGYHNVAKEIPEEFARVTDEAIREMG